LIGHAIPSPEASRNFLCEFHDEAKIHKFPQGLPMSKLAFVPGEYRALQGLAQVNRDLIQALGARGAGQKIATAGAEGFCRAAADA
jgi:hypothetical protein